MASNKDGFSLAEVLVAVGVFAFTIVGIVGFVGAMGKQTADVRDSDSATRIVDSVQRELQNRTGINGFSEITNLLGGTLLFASRDGAEFVMTTPNADSFFQIRLYRNEALSPPGNDNDAGFLVMTLELQWPVRAASNSRNMLIVPMAVRR